MKSTFAPAVLTFAVCFASSALAQNPAPAAPPASAAAPAGPSPVQKRIEAYLRHLYALGADTAVRVGSPKDTEVPGLQEVAIDVKIGENTESVKFYISKDGKFLLRGDLSDMTRDPLAEARAQLQINDAPSLGDPNAPITLVEFSDFECPICRSLHDVLRGLLPKYPGVRVVFKDFPLDQIHPWARTAAIAGRCAYQLQPQAFWKVYDLIYDGQQVISAANAWGKMIEFAGEAGLNPDAFKTCMAAPEAAAAVEASRANGMTLEIQSTPTVFVNGRRMVGADSRTLEQYLNYELAQLAGSKASGKK